MRHCIWTGFLILGHLMVTCYLTAQDFRIETEVFRGNSSEPISENLTLFSGNLILDFMLPTDRTRFPDEIVIYQSREKQFVLLDTRRQIKTEILEGEVLKILAALQNSSIAEKGNEFLFQPEFQEHFDISSGLLTLESEQLTYQVRGKRPTDENQLHRYFEFIGQFARLNATDPRRMPPFARLKLNQSLQKYGVIPEAVQLTITPSRNSPQEMIELRTTHNLISSLSEKDEKRIESAKRYWIDFKPVSLSQFRDLQKASLAATGDTEDR